MNIKIDIYLIISMMFLMFFRQIDSFIIFYIFIFLHELIHIIVALLLRIKVIELVFLPFGVNAKFEFGNNRIKEIIVASAGPLFSLFIAIFYKKFMIQNLFIFIVNILPIFPLDGGRIVKNVLILIFGVKKGVKIYKVLLRMVCIVLIILNIIVIVFLKSYNFIFFTLYVLQIANEEIKKDKIRNEISRLLNGY